MWGILHDIGKYYLHPVCDRDAYCNPYGNLFKNIKRYSLGANRGIKWNTKHNWLSLKKARNEEEKTDGTKGNMAFLNPDILIITINLNRVNIWMKRQK